MERQSFFESGDSDFLKKNKGAKSARSGERVEPPRPESETVPSDTPDVRQSVSERPYAPMAPLEGVISWRDKETDWKDPDAAEEDDDKDEEEEETSDSKAPASPTDSDGNVPEATVTGKHEEDVPPVIRHGSDTVSTEVGEKAEPEIAGAEPVETAAAAKPELTEPLPEFTDVELDDLPPITPREQEPETEVPVPLLAGAAAARQQREREEMVDTEQAIPEQENSQEQDETAATPQATEQYGGYDSYYPPYGPEPAYRRVPPAEVPESSATRSEGPAEYLPRPHTHGGILALLGLEHLARKGADRGVEKRLGERLDTGLREQEQRSDYGFERLERLQRDTAVEQQHYYRTHEAQQRRYESLHGPALTPEAQRRFETNQLPPEPEEEAPDQPRRIHVEPKQHIEHSTWHNIVVDKRGREVVGAIKYGEGFQGERRKEMARDELFAPGSSVPGGQAASPYSDRLPSGLTTPTLPQGHALRSDPQHQIEAHSDQVVSGVSNGWLWGMILLVLAAFFVAAFL